jgi:hypothetical protein
MKITYKTKAGKVKGSITTTIPVSIVNLLNIEKGDKIVWDADIAEKGAIITLHKELAEAK